MTHIRANKPDIRRRTNGTIDIDYYRSRALMERDAFIAGEMRRAISRTWPLLAAVALITAGYLAIPSTPHSPRPT
jgi:hypothetical protein